ncbi:MAG: iron donor protein CyaY [Gemmatimonadota bacterium]
MNESEFLTLAERTLDAIEGAVEACGADIEATRAGGVLTLELHDGSKIVINSQTPMRQIWVAARGGGFHFGRTGDDWRDTRDQTELFAALSRLISAQGGQAIVLRPAR